MPGATEVLVDRSRSMVNAAANFSSSSLEVREFLALIGFISPASFSLVASFAFVGSLAFDTEITKLLYILVPDTGVMSSLPTKSFS